MSELARVEADAYMTPPKLARAICERLFPEVQSARILEPSCGTGNFLTPIRECWPYADVTAFEIDLARAQAAGSKGDAKSLVFNIDSLSYPPTYAYNLVLGNPPYSIAEDFVEWAHGQIAPGGVIAFLLKLSFLCGKKRVKRLEKYRLAELHPIVGRAAFREDTKATDTHEYGLFVWRDGATSSTIKPHIFWKE